jgi:RIO-like serine/threonine protein kinase
MECLEGETLAQRLVKGRLPTEQVLRYAVEIAGALDKAHRSGITHRDLKPGNIMLTKSGAKLLDFGTDFEDVQFRGANLLDADFRYSKLKGAELAPRIDFILQIDPKWKLGLIRT